MKHEEWQSGNSFPNAIRKFIDGIWRHKSNFINLAVLVASITVHYCAHHYIQPERRKETGEQPGLPVVSFISFCVPLPLHPKFVFVPYVCSTHKGQKRVSDPPEPELPPFEF